MLFVINKEKVYAYIISIITVITLFCITEVVYDKKDSTALTSVNTVKSNNSIVNTTNNSILNNSSNNIIN